VDASSIFIRSPILVPNDRALTGKFVGYYLQASSTLHASYARTPRQRCDRVIFKT
jgi:hypothetical protein